MANRDRTICCSILFKETGKVLGLVSLANIDYFNQSAKLHIIIGKVDNKKEEVLTFSILSILSHAFNKMSLQRISLMVLEDDENERHLYEKLGFVREGIMRNAVYNNVFFKNMLLYSILISEFNLPDNEVVNKIFYNEKIPSYSIERVNSIYELRNIIKEVDAFECDYSNNNELIEKLFIASDFFVARNKNILGYYSIYANNTKSKEAFISLIAVDKRYRRKSVGKRLLEHSIDYARYKKMESIRLEVQSNNEGAISFYKNNGFAYIHDKNDESFFMERLIR